MLEKFVLIRTQTNDINLFSLLLSDYPGYPEKNPSVGDLLPLMAETRRKFKIGGVEELTTTYLCGLYEVVEVHQGTGYELAPDLRKCNIIELREDISGFGIRLGEAVECPNDVKMLIPQIQFAAT